MAGLNFDATNAPQLEEVEPIPAGWYNAMIVDSDVSPTAKQTGTKMRLEFQILDGQYAGRKVFTNVNIANQNPVAQEIGQKELSSICHATGVIQVQDSTQFHGIPIQIRVGIRAAEGNYDAQNTVKGYKASVQGQSSTVNPVAGVTSPVPQARPAVPPAPMPPTQEVPAAPAAPTPLVASPAQPAAPVASPAQPAAPAAPTAGVPPWQQNQS